MEKTIGRLFLSPGLPSECLGDIHIDKGCFY